jgi:hypothetical protein
MGRAKKSGQIVVRLAVAEVHALRHLTERHAVTRSELIRGLIYAAIGGRDTAADALARSAARLLLECAGGNDAIARTALDDAARSCALREVGP